MLTSVLKHSAVAGSLFLLLGISVAVAQPGAAPPPAYQGSTPGHYAPPPAPGYAPGYYHRQGLTLGFGFGIGTMGGQTGPIPCNGCGFQPLAGGFNMHIGGMLNPRLALVFELGGTGQQLDATGAYMLMQYSFMAAGQYWLSPRLWLKGGIGLAHLSLEYNDGYYADSEPYASGTALLAAVGYEILTGPRFSIDLQGRLSLGSYEALSEHIQAGTLGIGMNWH